MNKKMGYFPQLDAIRAIAVVMTLLSHYLSRVGLYDIPYLWYGVDIFFVISGFLITGILLNTEHNSIQQKLRQVKNFFVRRALRLFPAYYSLLFLSWFAFNYCNLYLWNNAFNPYFFTYIPNWFFFFYPEMANGSYNHLWSLGVEEQFYLIWPWLIFFLPLKNIKLLLILLILTSFGLRHYYFSIPNINMLPFCNLHTLGIGGLLAYYLYCDNEVFYFNWIIKRRELLFFIFFFLLLAILVFLKKIILYSILSDVLLTIDAALLILCSVKGWSFVGKLITKNKLIQYIGKISYGIYLYHMPVPDAIKAVGRFAGKNIDFKIYPFLYLFIFFCITFLTAYISYQLIEKPFLKIKSKWSV